MQPFIGNETCLLTYGDGVSDININKLIEFHKSHGKMITITAVHPGARFGELVLDESFVKKFEEKPQTQKGWINGGFFVIEPEFLDFEASQSSTPQNSLAKDYMKNCHKAEE